MTTRDWLLADSPTSRLQANVGRAYRVFAALMRNPHTPEHDVVALAVSVNVVTLPHTEVSHFRIERG